MLIKLKTTSKNLHQIVTLVVSGATISLHPAHQEAQEAISGSLASMAFRATILGSKARHRQLSHSCKVSWTAEGGR